MLCFFIYVFAFKKLIFYNPEMSKNIIMILRAFILFLR